MKVVHISNCLSIVNGADNETLYQIWLATKDIKQPYRISALPKNGDSTRYLIEEA